MKNAQYATNSCNLVLLPAKKATERPTRKKKSATLAYVRKSLRDQAAGLRNAARAMLILAILTVIFFCSCSGIAKDIYVAVNYLTFNVIDEKGGNIAALVCSLIGLLISGFTAIVGVFLYSSAESLIEESKKLNKEVK